jgi:hypothetical protein
MDVDTDIRNYPAQSYKRKKVPYHHGRFLHLKFFKGNISVGRRSKNR